MSIASMIATRLANHRWKSSLFAGGAVALVWHVLLNQLAQSQAGNLRLLSGLSASPLLVAVGIFLLSSLCFHLLRPLGEKKAALAAEKKPEDLRCNLNVHLLVGLYDENIFRNSDLPMHALPQVLLNTGLTNVTALAQEQTDTLLAAQRFHQQPLHQHHCQSSDLQSNRRLLETVLSSIRMKPNTQDVHFFQGVLETSNENDGVLYIPWAFSMAVAHAETPQEALENQHTLRSLELKIMAHFKTAGNEVLSDPINESSNEPSNNECDPLLPLPLFIANWLT